MKRTRKVLLWIVGLLLLLVLIAIPTVYFVLKSQWFRDAIHLCKVFQRIEGTSPSEYRAARAMHER